MDTKIQRLNQLYIIIPEPKINIKMATANPCSDCKMVKVLEEFRPGRNQCKQCDRRKQREYYSANKERKLQYNRTYKKETKETFYETHCCSCGGKYSLHHQKRHKCSKKHQKYLNSNNSFAA